jgi:hypothetical protein
MGRVRQCPYKTSFLCYFLDLGVIFNRDSDSWQLEPNGAVRGTSTKCFGNWVISGLGNLGYDVSTINVLKLLANTMV